MRRSLVQSFLIVVILSSSFAFTPAGAQVPGVSVSAGTHISRDSPKTPFAETFLAINPHDPKNLIAASMVISDGSLISLVYASNDGGRTWRRAQTTTPDNTIFHDLSWDPTVYFDAKGTAFFAVIRPDTGIRLSRSNDGGFTWEPPVAVPAGMCDREFISFDSTGGKFNGRMYVVASTAAKDIIKGKWQYLVTSLFSSDRGRTFSAVRLLGSVEQNITAFDPLITSQGKLVIPYRTMGTGSPISGHLGTVVSEDGGETFSLSQRGPVFTWGAEAFRINQSAGVPRAAIDTSTGRFRDRIYFTWSDFDGKRYVVKVSHSSDLGRTWSTPIIVNDNTNDTDSANPAIAVNKDGTVAIVFNDRRGDPKNSCYELYYAVSLDGATTFLPNVKASHLPTCPGAMENWATEIGSFAEEPSDPILSKGERRLVIGMENIPNRWPNGGDTQGIVAGTAGVFHSAWINGESGVMQLWSKEITVERPTGFQSPFAVPREDLSRDLKFEVSDPSIDFVTNTVSMKVRLVNITSVELTGPFTVVLDDIRSSMKEMAVVNSDNGLQARGAAWNFTIQGKTSLQPQEKSEERIFRWKFTGGPPEHPDSPLWAHFIVLGQPQKLTNSP